MDLLKLAKEKCEKYEKLADKIQGYLQTAPRGKLRICKKKQIYQYYVADRQKRQYITKEKLELAKKIAQRDYLKKLLPRLLDNLKIVEYILANYEEESLAACYKNLSEGRKALVTPFFIDKESFVQNWQNQTYERKKDAPDKTLMTIKKEFVRSKSEVLIADYLTRKKIPYHYEYPLKLKSGITLYPDFFCLNQRTRKEYYWEHLGKMDDPEYALNTAKRLADYEKHGIIPGINLILTSETRYSPLSTHTIEELAEYFLL